MEDYFHNLTSGSSEIVVGVKLLTISLNRYGVVIHTVQCTYGIVVPPLPPLPINKHQHLKWWEVDSTDMYRNHQFCCMVWNPPLLCLVS